MMDLVKILELHKKWVRGEGGKRAALTGADLTGADLTGADLTGADLRRADLTGADLTGADLRGADLTGADLRGADLRRANITGADLRGADLDFGCWPLWCGSVNAKIDERLARQLLYHAFSVSKAFCAPTQEQIEFINEFHRVKSGEIPAVEGTNKEGA